MPDQIRHGLAWITQNYSGWDPASYEYGAGAYGIPQARHEPLTPEEAATFSEPDEDPGKIFGIFDAGGKGTTGRSTP